MSMCNYEIISSVLSSMGATNCTPEKVEESFNIIKQSDISSLEVLAKDDLVLRGVINFLSKLHLFTENMGAI